MTKKRTKNTLRAGFTLLEVMVSLTAGGIALGSIYAIGASATKHFQEQARISAAQTSLRSAMATLKHDFQRAGFMSTPNTNEVGQACAPPTFAQDGWVGAVNGFLKNVTKPSKLDPSDLNTVKDADGVDFFSVDRVWLTGNYSTSGEYPNISVESGGSVVIIPMAWQTFQRDFTEWGGAGVGTCNNTVFQSVFTEDRLVRLHAQDGSFFFSRIASAACSGNVDSGTASVTLKDVVPSNCSMDGGWIAPVHTMFYHVEDAESARGEDDFLQRTTVLRRSEVKAEARTEFLETALGGSLARVEDRSLLDYVVRFKVDFLMVSGGRISYVPMLQTEWQDTPHRVRAAIIDLAVRTPQQESNFTQDVPTSAFKLFVGKGAARVRRMRAEVLLPNIANRNL